MARLFVHIEMDNADFDENPQSELARIFRDLADRMENGISDVTLIRDRNGNRIGQAEYYQEG